MEDICCTVIGSAHAEPKPFAALTKADHMEIEYQFSPGVQWCFEQISFTLALMGGGGTVDINSETGLITIDVGKGEQVVWPAAGFSDTRLS